ncbi:unnamed protein product [Boreogadus saida]
MQLVRVLSSYSVARGLARSRLLELSIAKSTANASRQELTLPDKDERFLALHRAGAVGGGGGGATITQAVPPVAPTG